MIKISSLLLLSLALCLLFCTLISPNAIFSDPFSLLHRGSGVHLERGARPRPHRPRIHAYRPRNPHPHRHHYPQGQGLCDLSEREAVVHLGVDNPRSRPILRCHVTTADGQRRREGHHTVCQVPQSRRGWRTVSGMLASVVIYCLDYILI